MAEIVCIGQAVIDCITRGKEEKPHKKNVYRAEKISLNTGGDALNESVILSRLGHRVKLVCGVGNDVAGNLILHEMEARGIDVSDVTQSDSLTTPIANLMVNRDGTRVSVNSEATMLTGYAPSEHAIKGAKVVSLASLFRAPWTTAIRSSVSPRRPRHRAILCADTKMPTYRKLALDDIREILPLIDYIFPNENEGEYYTGETEYMAMAEHFRSLGVKNVIIKTGEKGCTVSGGQDQFSMPAYSVDAVDSTGGGDNFVAGFISALLHGGNLGECCQYGTACAAVCVQSIGATTGVKSRESVEDMLHKIRH